ncbi:MAG: Zn-ribbon domain-containing OB-fold protein [Burkholderiales bacterium]
MTVTGTYLGMSLSITDLDGENRAYFHYCAQGELRLQRCKACALVRYPPGPACPWCSGNAFDWVPMSGRGTVYSYTEVRHAVQQAFRAHVPYLALLVELDEQRGQPTEHEAIRMIGNLAMPDGTLAPPEVVRTVGIGSRVRIVFAPAGPDLAIPLWTLDAGNAGSAAPWRYPE